MTATLTTKSYDYEWKDNADGLTIKDDWYIHFQVTEGLGKAVTVTVLLNGKELDIYYWHIDGDIRLEEMGQAVMVPYMKTAVENGTPLIFTINCIFTNGTEDACQVVVPIEPPANSVIAKIKPLKCWAMNKEYCYFEGELTCPWDKYNMIDKTHSQALLVNENYVDFTIESSTTEDPIYINAAYIPIPKSGILELAWSKYLFSLDSEGVPGRTQILKIPIAIDDSISFTQNYEIKAVEFIETEDNTIKFQKGGRVYAPNFKETGEELLESMAEESVALNGISAVFDSANHTMNIKGSPIELVTTTLFPIQVEFTEKKPLCVSWKTDSQISLEAKILPVRDSSLQYGEEISLTNNISIVPPEDYCVLRIYVSYTPTTTVAINETYNCWVSAKQGEPEINFSENGITAFRFIEKA